MNKKNILLFFLMLNINSLLTMGSSNALLVGQKKIDDKNPLATQLVNACKKGNIQLVEQLLKIDAPIKEKIPSYYGTKITPLCVASDNGHYKIVELLLKKGASISEGYTDLNGATKTPLYEASLNGHFETAELLLEKGAPVSEGYTDLNGVTKTPLYEASLNGHFEIVELLLKKGAPVSEGCTNKDKETTTPLYVASWKGYNKIVQLLLKKGASVSNGLLSSKKETTITPLYIASYSGKRETVQLLLDGNASVSEGHTAKGEITKTPLYMASLKGHYKTVQFLLERGASYKRVTSYGQNAYQIPKITDTVKQVIKNHAIKEQGSCPISIEPFKKGQQLHFLGCCTTFVSADAFSQWKCTRLERVPPLPLICPCCQKTDISSELDTLEYPFEQTAEEQNDTTVEEEVSAAGLKEDTDS